MYARDQWVIQCYNIINETALLTAVDWRKVIHVGANDGNSKGMGEHVRNI